MARVSSDKPATLPRPLRAPAAPDELPSPRKGAPQRLPEVTLVCVQPRLPALGVATLQHCMRHLQFGEVLLFTDLQKLPQAPPGVQIKSLRIDSGKAYAEFMLRGLMHYVHTSHVLTVQWNGFVLDGSQWDPAFQLYDYIAAPIPAGMPLRVSGHGSFSLRSRRLLLALQDPAMRIRAPEDHCIRHDNRQRLVQQFDVRFAPAELSRRFAFAEPPNDVPTLGFHGLGRLPQVLSTDALRRLLRGLPDEMLAGRVGYRLGASAIKHGVLEIAEAIVTKRRALNAAGWRTLELRLRLAIAQRRAAG